MSSVPSSPIGSSRFEDFKEELVQQAAMRNLAPHLKDGALVAIGGDGSWTGSVLGGVAAGDLAQMNTVGTFDAGGMYGPIRLGKELTNGCFVGMQVKNAKWQRLVPAEGYICQ